MMFFRYVDLSWSNSGVGFRFLAESWLRLSKSFLSLMLKNSSKQRTNPVYDNSKPGSAPILALYQSELISSSSSFAFVSQCKGDTLFFAGDFSDTERCFWRMKGFFLRLRVIDATAPKPVIFSTSSFPRLLIQGDGIAGYSSNLRFL